jgi:phospholipid-binding lipoprotein MlaA
MLKSGFLCAVRTGIFFTVIIVSGCASNQVVTDNSDPWEPANRVSYNFTDSLDRYLIKPAAEGYVKITPTYVRQRVTNFFSNILYLNVILNSYLQGKLHQGTQDLLRFVYNSTFGIAGLYDVSTPIDMPEHQEDIGQTLATWGLSQGPFVYVPVLGPNTVRNVPNIGLNILLSPLTYTPAYVVWPATILFTVNTRANLLEATRIRDEAAVDAYIFTREAFLQRREFLIYDGNPPAGEYDDIFDESYLEDF